MTFLHTLQKALDNRDIDHKVHGLMADFYQNYSLSLESCGLKMTDFENIFDEFLQLVIKQVAHPHQFEPFHRKITEPYNYYTFGINLLRPLVVKERSRVFHLENVKKIINRIAKGENVILLANHQTEVDPQLMSLALEDSYHDFASEVIFVAGDRVLTDPMAIPFSLGRHLLCIYSKRHIDSPPEEKAKKQHHNQRTMRRMKELLQDGGKCIYVAPSGGRDRPDADGNLTVAPFDPDSIEMFRLIAKQAKTKTHFYPLSLATYDILPPPDTLGTDVGEKRRTKRHEILFCFGNELDMEQFPGSEIQDRHAKRSARATHIWNVVKTDYDMIKKG